MCVIIDICAIKSVFDECDKDYEEYKPVSEWIMKGKGKIVYGGKTYEKELKKYFRAAKLFEILAKVGKIVCSEDEMIDRREEEVKTMYNSVKDLDDAHIIAIAIVTGCRIICTKDIRAEKYIKDNKIYDKGCKKPKIYKYAKQKDELLSDKYIVDCCKPARKLKKDERNGIKL